LSNSNPAAADGGVEPCNQRNANYCLPIMGKARGSTTISTSYQGHTAFYTLTVQ